MKHFIHLHTFTGRQLNEHLIVNGYDKVIMILFISVSGWQGEGVCGGVGCAILQLTHLCGSLNYKKKGALLDT